MQTIGQIVFIVTIAIVPSILGLWQIQRSHRQLDRRWDQIRRRSWARSPDNDATASDAIDLHTAQALPLGHSNCIWSAKSPHLRCTVNPYGPCFGCRDYTPIDSNW
jgi:hypothetical protein